MNEYARLQDRVEAGSISIINMVAIPRSVSTALGRVLNEVDRPSVFINEPINRNNRSVDSASAKILEVVDAHGSSSDNPLLVITKNMAAYLTSDAYEQLSSVSDAVVWSVRNPLVQIGSLVTRMANDIAFENGADEVDQSEVGPYLDAVTQHLVDGPISTNFSRTGWESIANHFYNPVQPNRSVIVDGGEFTLSPHTVLAGACKKLGLPYNRAMADSWSEGYINVNVGTSRFDTIENAWTRQASSSMGISHTERAPLDLDALPDELRTHITDVALPVYEAMKRAA